MIAFAEVIYEGVEYRKIAWLHKLWNESSWHCTFFSFAINRWTFDDKKCLIRNRFLIYWYTYIRLYLIFYNSVLHSNGRYSVWNCCRYMLIQRDPKMWLKNKHIYLNSTHEINGGLSYICITIFKMEVIELYSFK